MTKELLAGDVLGFTLAIVLVLVQHAEQSNVHERPRPDHGRGPNSLRGDADNDGDQGVLLDIEGTRV